MIWIWLAGLAGAFGIGFAAHGLFAEIRAERPLADDDLDRVLRRNLGATLEYVRAALSGPLQPDIDGADPFGDPPDDDDPEAATETLGALQAEAAEHGWPVDPGASEAELAWAAEHVVRDTSDPAYWWPENQHALRVLGIVQRAPEAEDPPAEGGPAAFGQLGELYPDQCRRHAELVDSWLAAGMPGELPAWPELVPAGS